MTSTPANYEPKSIFEVFEHMLKCFSGSARDSFTKVYLEIRNVLGQLAEYLVIQIAAEKSHTGSSQKTVQATESVQPPPPLPIRNLMVQILPDQKRVVLRSLFLLKNHGTMVVGKLEKKIIP